MKSNIDNPAPVEPCTLTPVEPCTLTPVEPCAPTPVEPHLICVSQPEARPWLSGITHVYTDLDSTMLAPGGKLLTTHNGEPSAALPETLVALKRAGIEVIIVTGRNGTQGDDFLRLLDLNTYIGEVGCVVQQSFGIKKQLSYELGDWVGTVLGSGFALEDGAGDVLGGGFELGEQVGAVLGGGFELGNRMGTVLGSSLDLGALPEGLSPCQLMQKSGVIDRLTSEFAGKLELHNPYPSERRVTFAFRGLVDAEKVARLLADEPLPLELADNGEIHPLVHTLVDCPEIHIYHLVPRGTSKALAVKADIMRRGISREQTLAIGDSMGDIEMGDYTRSLVVMGNALHSRTTQEALTMRAKRAARDGRDATTLFTSAFTADGWVELARALLAAQ